jgi:Spy/CpxP family protein refolding chaperone
MKKTLILTAGFVLLVAAAAFVHADGPGGHRRMGFMHGEHGPHGDMSEHAEHIAKALDLTDEQKAAARTIHQEVAEKARPLAEQVHQQWREIHEMLEGGTADATAVGQRVIAAHAAREQLKALHEEAMEKMSALLNAEQLEKFKKLHEMHGDREGFGFRMRGHGDY